jgi:hypothetical protein
MPRKTLGYFTAATLMAALFAAPVSATSEGIADPILELPFTGQFQDCGTCEQNCTSNHHEFYPGGGPDRAYNENEHGCADGWCSVAHPSFELCYEAAPVAFEQLNERVWSAAVVDGDMAELQSIFDEFGENAILNGARRALQVKGCSGRIILSVPVSAEQIAELTLDK